MAPVGSYLGIWKSQFYGAAKAYGLAKTADGKNTALLSTSPALEDLVSYWSKEMQRPEIVHKLLGTGGLGTSPGGDPWLNDDMKKQVNDYIVAWNMLWQSFIDPVTMKAKTLRMTTPEESLAIWRALGDLAGALDLTKIAPLYWSTVWQAFKEAGKEIYGKGRDWTEIVLIAAGIIGGAVVISKVVEHKRG
jgi:hypothetical protein